MQPFIRRVEMARMLAVSTRTLDRWVKEGIDGVRLRAYKHGRTVAFTWSAVEAWRKTLEKRLK